MTDDEIAREAVSFVNAIFSWHTPLDKRHEHTVKCLLLRDKPSWQMVENLGDRLTLALGYAIGLKKGLGK